MKWFLTYIQLYLTTSYIRHEVDLNGAVSSDDEGKGSEPKEGEQSESDEESEVIFLGYIEQANQIVAFFCFELHL